MYFKYWKAIKLVVDISFPILLFFLENSSLTIANNASF